MNASSTLRYIYNFVLSFIYTLSLILIWAAFFSDTIFLECSVLSMNTNIQVKFFISRVLFFMDFKILWVVTHHGIFSLFPPPPPQLI